MPATLVLPYSRMQNFIPNSQPIVEIKKKTAFSGTDCILNLRMFSVKISCKRPPAEESGNKGPEKFHCLTDPISKALLLIGHNFEQGSEIRGCLEDYARFHSDDESGDSVLRVFSGSDSIGETQSAPCLITIRLLRIGLISIPIHEMGC